MTARIRIIAAQLEGDAGDVMNMLRDFVARGQAAQRAVDSAIAAAEAPRRSTPKRRKTRKKEGGA